MKNITAACKAQHVSDMPVHASVFKPSILASGYGKWADGWFALNNFQWLSAKTKNGKFLFKFYCNNSADGKIKVLSASYTYISLFSPLQPWQNICFIYFSFRFFFLFVFFFICCSQLFWHFATLFQPHQNRRKNKTNKKLPKIS